VTYFRVIWLYIALPSNNENVITIYWRGRIYNKDRERFRIYQPERGVFDLVISKMNASDAGIYRCQESSGRQGGTCTELIVTGDINFEADTLSHKLTHGTLFTTKW